MCKKLLPTQFIADTGERIYRIPCDFHRSMTSYVHLILGTGPAVLVDCGSGEGNCFQEITDAFHYIRSNFHETFDISQIGRIIITHAHIDHGGGAAEFLEKTSAEVMCHSYDAPVMTRYDERASIGNRRFSDFLKTTGTAQELCREIIEAFGFTPGRAKSVEKVHILSDGEKLDNLTIHHTPGHSPGHICIQVGNRHLISGDHILSKTLTPIWPERLTPHSGMTHFLDSLDKIRRIAGHMTALPGHEEVIPLLSVRLDMAEKSHFRRNERVLRLLRENETPMTVSELARRMYLVQTGTWALVTLTDIAARIEYLEQHNLVSTANATALEQEKEDIYLYQPVRHSASRST
ncbi:MBL fold hydrolase [Campylobacterota bacterium]|nr:MBL fold hydrolase [Campylobacterota bacterium]